MDYKVINKNADWSNLMYYKYQKYKKKNFRFLDEVKKIKSLLKAAMVFSTPHSPSDSDSDCLSIIGLSSTAGTSVSEFKLVKKA